MPIDKEQFLTENCGLIKKVANKYHFDTPKFSYEDLVAVGNKAVIKALDFFDETKGTKPQTYVFWAIDRDIRDYVRKNKHDLYVSTYHQRKHYKEFKKSILAVGDSGQAREENRAPDINHGAIGPNSPVALRLDWNWDLNAPAAETKSLADVIPSGEPPPEQKMMVEEQRDILMDEISRLPERQQFIVKSRHLEGASFVELGRTLGVTKQRAKQLEQKAFSVLRGRLESRLGNFIARPDGLARRAKK